jgi:hypothetical protein
MITPTEKYRKLMRRVETTSKPVSATTSSLYGTSPALIQKPTPAFSELDLDLLMCRIEFELSLINSPIKF